MGNVHSEHWSKRECAWSLLHLYIYIYIRNYASKLMITNFFFVVVLCMRQSRFSSHSIYNRKTRTNNVPNCTKSSTLSMFVRCCVYMSGSLVTILKMIFIPIVHLYPMYSLRLESTRWKSKAINMLQFLVMWKASSSCFFYCFAFSIDAYVVNFCNSEIEPFSHRHTQTKRMRYSFKVKLGQNFLVPLIIFYSWLNCLLTDFTSYNNKVRGSIIW